MERSDLKCRRCFHHEASHLYYDNSMCFVYKCCCPKFVLDNLKHLEMLSKEKEVADLK